MLKAEDASRTCWVGELARGFMRVLTESALDSAAPHGISPPGADFNALRLCKLTCARVMHV